MVEGKVEKWFEAKGYGFIKPDDGEQNVFVHYTGIKDDGQNTTTKGLEVGQRVEFDIEQGNKGPKAANVVVIG